MMQADQ